MVETILGCHSANQRIVFCFLIFAMDLQHHLDKKFRQKFLQFKKKNWRLFLFSKFKNSQNCSKILKECIFLSFLSFEDEI